MSLLCLFLLAAPIFSQESFDFPSELQIINVQEKVASNGWSKFERLLFPWEYGDFKQGLGKIISEETTNYISRHEGLRLREDKQRILCFYLSDVKNVLLCLFQSNEVLEAATGRAMLHAWANRNIMPGISLFDEDNNETCSYMVYSGANLRDEDFRWVLNNMDTLDDGDLSTEDLKIEKKFYKEVIVPELKKKDFKFVFAGATVWEENLRSQINFDDETILHEIMHAKYASDDKFRADIDDYINKELINTNSEASKILKHLEEHDSDVYPALDNDHYVRNNEIFVRLMIPAPTSLEQCDDPTNSLASKIEATLDILKMTMSKKHMLPALWYRVHEYAKVGNDAFFRSRVINFYCDKSISFPVEDDTPVYIMDKTKPCN